MANLSLIKTLAKERKITLKSLSQSIGMTEQGMQSLIKNNATNTETLERICRQVRNKIAPLAQLLGEKE